MIEVTIDSIRVSLMSQHRVVILKDADTDRYLPIWIGACEADAITIELQGVEVARPFTHDLLKSAITQLGGKIKSVVINDLRNEVFYAQIVLDVNGKRMDIDSRPSDALALAVRAKVAIYVADSVMENASITPEEDISEGAGDEKLRGSPFKDLIDGLNLDDFDEDKA
jgi:bifunctional DNase/RNase